MGLHDLPFVVETHLHYFPDSFFARLGPRFMVRYYRTFLDGPLSTAIVVERDGVPSGYLVGILARRQHRELLLRHHGVGLALAAMIRMSTHPHLAVTFLTTRLTRYARSVRNTPAYTKSPTTTLMNRPGPAVLSHIAILEAARCQGLGTRLTEEFIRQASNAGCSGACLVTMSGTSGAGTFYERRHWKQMSQRSTARGRELLRYEYDLDGDDTRIRMNA